MGKYLSCSPKVFVCHGNTVKPSKLSAMALVREGSILRGGEQCCDLQRDAGKKRGEGHVCSRKPVPEGWKEKALERS